MSERFIEMFGLYGGVVVLAFVSGMFPPISIEAFLIAWCSLRPVTWPEFVALVLLAATGHQIAKTVCYVAGMGGLESPRVKPRIAKWQARIDRWNKYPWPMFVLASTVGLPPMWLIGFIAHPMMHLRFVPFTIVCFVGRAGRYATLAMIPMLAK